MTDANIVVAEPTHNETEEAHDNDAAIQPLQELIAVLQEGDRSASAAAWVRMQNPDILEALAAAWNEDSDRINSFIATIETIPRNIVRARNLRSAVRRLAEEQQRRQVASQIDILEDQLNQLMSVAASLGHAAPPATLADPTLLAQLRVPRGYQIDASGVYRLSASVDGEMTRHKVASAPIFLVARTSDITTGEAKRQVVWRGAGGWCSRVVDRRVILDTRRVLDLADLEAPVSSPLALPLISFFSDYEAENAHRLPSIRTSSHMGWITGDSFLLPDVHYAADDNAGRFSLTPPAGLESQMKGWVTHGTWDGWIETAAAGVDYPYMMVAIYASAAAPLLHILNVPGFVVDFSGETSGGKTTALRLAASVWGRPGDSFPTAMFSWDATKVWIERMAGFIHSLPLILDETKRAKHPRVVRDVIYDFCQGQGRGRGSIEGTRHMSTWCSILLSSGEGAATSFSEDAGTRARVLSLTGKPLGHDTLKGGQVSDQLQRGVAANYGWLGRAVIRYLMANHSRWDEIRTAYQAAKARYVGAAQTAVARRHAAHLAVLEVAANIVHQLGVPEPTSDPFAVLFEAQIQAALDADRPLAALEDVVTWCAMHQTSFWGRHEELSDGSPRIPARGWLGTWSAWDSWEYIAISTVALKRVLTDLGHRPDEILHRWREREWMLLGGKDRTTTTKAVRINKAPTRCYCLKRSAVNIAMDDD